MDHVIVVARNGPVRVDVTDYVQAPSCALWSAILEAFFPHCWENVVGTV